MGSAVEGAAKKLVETRIAEGEQLKQDLLDKLDGMLSFVAVSYTHLDVYKRQ